MAPDKRVYLVNFLQSLLDTLENENKLKQAKQAYGENDERYKATTSFDFSGWPDQDIFNFSAAYFEAIAFASEQCKDLDNGAEISFKYQLYVQNKMVPAFIRWTDDESRFETIKNNIKAKHQQLKASDPEENFAPFWGIFGGAVAVATVGAFALGAASIGTKR